MKEKRKTKSILFVLFLIMLLFPVCVHAQGFDSPFSGAADVLRQFPPMITGVSQSPEEPVAGDDVTITAVVKRQTICEDYEYLDGVALHFSVDGGATWEDVEMEQGDDETAWTGVIPGQDAGVEVSYYISAKDSVGNVAMELPPSFKLNSEWPSADDTENDPHDNLLHLFDHEDKPDNEIPSYLDVLSMRFGYDDENVYFRVEFESPVSKGTVTPLDINAYMFAIINTSMDISPELQVSLSNFCEGGKKPSAGDFTASSDEIMDFLSSLWLWFYIPLLEIVPPIPGIGKLPSITLAHIDPNANGCPINDISDFERIGVSAMKCIVFKDKGWKYELKGNFLDLTFDRENIGHEDGDTINFLLGNLRVAGSDILALKQQWGDVSYVGSIVLKENGYVVGE